MPRMSSRRIARTLAAAAVVPALALGVAPAATAQEETDARGSLDNFRDGLAGPDGSVASIDDTLGSLGADSLSQPLSVSGLPLFAGSTGVGLASFVGLTPDLFAGEAAGVPAPDPTITETRVVGRVTETVREDRPWTSDARREVYAIDYAPMQRTINVEVYRATTGEATAPNVVLLDGVGAPYASGFAQHEVPAAMPDANVIIPTGGVAAMWADWQNEDPALGIPKWETFLTEDLPALLQDPAIALQSNGKTAVGGVSMGASSAMTLAAKHPQQYDGVLAVSGCYQSDGLGQILADYTVASRGGDINNMWGPHGSDEWLANDARKIVTENPSVFEGKPIYFTSATGAAAPGEFEGPEGDGYNYDPIHFALGAMLEQGVNSCSSSFSRALDGAGVEHTWVEVPQGMHNWWTFKPQLITGWEAIKGRL